MKLSYNPKLVVSYLAEHGIPTPIFEHRFAECIGRRWRFDLAWELSPTQKLALEVQGGLFIPKGRHVFGASLIKEHEKLNTAAAMGWRVLFCQPKDLLTQPTIIFIKKSLGLP
jgi:hypothetical protein